MLQTLLSDEAVICRTEVELSVAHFYSCMQTEKLIRKYAKWSTNNKRETDLKEVLKG